MSDFTPAQAKKWVAQESAKCTTKASADQRIKSEQSFVKMMGDSDLAKSMPNSSGAHKELIAVLQVKFPD